MPTVIPIQETLRPTLPVVHGCRDYTDEKRLLERIDRILTVSGVEQLFLRLSLERFEAKVAGTKAEDNLHATKRHIHNSRQALRCTILKHLTNQSYRPLSAALARTPLYRWFCGCPDFEVVRVPGKSTLQNYAQWLPEEEMQKVLAALHAALANEDKAQEIGMEAELDQTIACVDTTCLKANVHFPIDWVLLRDAVGTLVRAILVIRSHGLKKRMPSPEDFLREINSLSMSMSAAGRRNSGSNKERKKVLRKIKALTQVVEAHAQRYRKALDEEWHTTDLSRKSAEVILRRIDAILGQLPEVRRQAHERIIVGRLVPNAKKILSLYEPDIHVVVRGKAGAEVEFGNSLFIAENADGFIIDHQLKQEQSRGDARVLSERLPMISTKCGGELYGIIGDRGFSSEAIDRQLKEADLFNGICPKDPRKLVERMKDEIFSGALRRRAQTEGRVGILKNVFLGGIPLAKGFERRQLQVSWAVLAHNVWVASRLPWKEDRRKEAKAA
jgi:hypothetical protein